MPTVGTTSKPAYVYDAGSDTWIPIGPGEHSHSYIPNTLVDAKGDILTATAADTPAILAAGTNGQYLSANSSTATGLEWVTASSGGMTLLSTTSLTGNSVTISSISGSYKNLYILGRGISTSVNENVNIRFNSDSGSNYSFGRIRITNTTLAGYSPLNDTFLEVLEAHDSSAWNLAGFFQITIPRYTESEIKSYWMGSLGSQNSTTKKSDLRQGTYNSTSAISSITIYVSTGSNTFSSGTVYVYGVS